MHAEHGVVCTSQPLASAAGLEVLMAGGNAVDAAICANAVLGVVEPMSCGLGGDLFAIVWQESERKLHGLNASGRAPYDWSLDVASGLDIEKIPTYGPLTWTVPGCTSGWRALLERFGSRNLDLLLQPAIRHAFDGYTVTPVIARDWAAIDPRQYPGWADTFAPGLETPPFGACFRNPDLARTLEILAREGEAAFYEGEIAERVVSFSQSWGGHLSHRDFRDHTVDWVEPVSSSYRGCDIWELPPNGQGVATLQMLNLLERFDIDSLQPNSATYLHLLIEAKKLAYEDRARFYADPEFAHIPVAELISKDYAEARARRIDPKRASPQVAAGNPVGGTDTVYLTTADAEGNMVSLIQSIYHGFGSREVPTGLGFALQNRGADFSLDPSHPNRLEPHKRPFHTIIPGFVTRKGMPLFSFGVMGGDFQPQGHVQILVNILDFGMTVQEAGDESRVAHFGSSTPVGVLSTGAGEVGWERGIPEAVLSQLTGMGHRVRSEHGVFGGYQGIWRDESPRHYHGASDPRKDGCALGY
jgi:gamma-glutamyltranspeptidase/glutathione hydrolase